MQKRGSPVNRIPIMAKHVLDLYELYRLVVAKGGLVEVINKKLWREITKGLNLPSSITSAAFTLRTQYMKYLYPYECDKLKMSTPQELQSAIDGNRREGRRPVYGFEYASPGGMSSSGNGAGGGSVNNANGLNNNNVQSGLGEWSIFNSNLKHNINMWRKMYKNIDNFNFWIFSNLHELNVSLEKYLWEEIKFYYIVLHLY